MFAPDLPPTHAEIDTAEQELVWLEGVIARARARQVALVRWLDEVKVHRVHASRSMEEWTAAHLDVSPTTARDLLTAVRAAAGGDAFPPPPAGERGGRGRRMPDALTTLAQDYVNGTSLPVDTSPGTVWGDGVRRCRRCGRDERGAGRRHRSRSPYRDGHHRPGGV